MLRKIARAYLLSIGVWCALSLLTGWQYRIFDQDLNIHSSLVDMLLLAESRGVAFALLTPPIFYFVRRYAGRARNPILYVAVYAAGLGPFMILYACIRWVVLPPWDAVAQQYVPRSAHGPLTLIRVGFADQITMYIAIIAAAHAYEYFVRARKQELERYEFQQALAASELQALKMQLHPHFLFNTLHGISMLIDTDREAAKGMIVKLSALLRTALLHKGSDLISLREELDFAAKYLDLERMRFGTRLTVTWSISPDAYPILVPQMILQPLVENAIQHGITSSRGNGWMELSVQRKGGTLELKVRNSIGNHRPGGAGVGLRNTRARLRYLYPGEGTLSFTLEGRTATTTIVLPVLSFEQRSADVTLPDIGSIGWEHAADHASTDHRR